MAIARKLEGREEILLVLTPEEAQVLADIGSMIGGTPETTRRGLSDGIYWALEALGIRHARTKPDAKGSITFKVKALLTKDELREVTAMAKEYDGFIPAIKRIREITGMSLYNAKLYAEELRG